MSNKTNSSKKSNYIFIIATIIVLVVLLGIYRKYNYNEFTKAENILGITKFTRDSKIKYGKSYSYKIEANEFNDSIFYKKLSVKPNTPYKLSCMVKTENVVNENDIIGSGAQMSIVDTVESSEAITGTTDWQKLEFIFDSKNREEIEIGFRLGGNKGNSKGTVWFSDFKLEEGIKDNSSEWNVAFFIMENVDVTINNENIKLSMSRTDIDNMKDNIERFKKSAKELSGNRMTVDYDIYEISTPVTSVTYSEEFANYLDPTDVYELIKDYLKNEEYDYIFVAVRLGDTYENVEIQVNDWIGLRTEWI